MVRHNDRYAIVGISCLFPGAATPDEFWRNLDQGVDSRTDGSLKIFADGAPPERNSGRPHQIYCTRGGFIKDFDFDPSGYCLPATYLRALDPMFHWSVQVTRDALNDAGHHLNGRRFRGERTGLILGNAAFASTAAADRVAALWLSAVDSGLRQAGFDPGGSLVDGEPSIQDNPLPTAHNLWSGGMPARVAAAAVGISGPQFALDGACASVLYSTKLACDYLAVGRADMMLVGAVCGQDVRSMHLSFSDLHAYPKDGFSQPFDASSGGTLTGQGAGMMVIKRLSDAHRDGDRIHAVIESVELTNDGVGRHTLVPQRGGQVDAYRRAYAAAGLDPSAVQYVECHATGTPLGDGVELSGIHEFFGPSGVPLLGSVKSNVGHLLSAAGMPSMIKTILALRHGSIPPTPGIGTPLDAAGDRLVRERTPWPGRGVPRRAGVSSFGFGGTNAHLLLAEAAAHPSHPPSRPVALPRVAITGLGCHLGPFQSVDEFEQGVHHCRTGFRAMSDWIWRGLHHDLPDSPPAMEGGYVSEFSCDTLKSRIPPTDLDGYNDQRTLFIEVAEQALSDAGFRQPACGRREPRRVAVVVAAELNTVSHSYLARYEAESRLTRRVSELGLAGDAEAVAELIAAAQRGIADGWTTNAVLSFLGGTATKVSSLWNFTGPSFTVAADSAGSAAAVEAAALILLDETVDAVLVGAVDFPGNLADSLARQNLSAMGGEPGLGIGGTGGWRTGEGAAALVLTRAEEAERAYATIDAMEVHRAADSVDVPTDTSAVSAVARAVLQAAAVTPTEVDFVAMHSSGIPAQDAAELDGLAAVWTAPASGERSAALGAAAAYVGDTQLVSTLASVILTALNLYHCRIPATPGWQGPAERFGETLSNSAFYVPTDTRPWLRASKGSARRAVINGFGTAGTYVGLLMSSASVRGDVAEVEGPAVHGQMLIPVGGVDLEDLMRRTTRLRDGIDEGMSLRGLAEAVAPASGDRVRMVLCANTAEGVRRELEQAVGSVPEAFRAGEEWVTPGGSFATPDPIGADGKVALVFPGMLSAYPGVGADMFRVFPGLFAEAERAVDCPADLIKTDLLYSKTIRPDNADEQAAAAKTLLQDFNSVVDVSSSFAWLSARALRLIGLPVQGAVGYSLGEVSMLYALGVCEPSSHGPRERELAADVFHRRLSGPKLAVREAWQLSDEVADDLVWSSAVVFDDADKVKAAAAQYDRVFITQVNTATEVVIAGDPDQCAEFVAALGSSSLPAAVSHVVHCPIPDPVQLAASLYRKTRAVDDLELFSSSTYTAITDFDPKLIAANCAATLRQTIDFPRLLTSMSEQGYRYFVEVGPGGNCTRWIRETLAGSGFLAESVDRRREPAAAGFGRVLAKLVGHGLPIDLTPFLPAESTPCRRAPSVRRINRGGPPVADLVSEGARSVVERLSHSVPERIDETLITFQLRTLHDELPNPGPVVLDRADLVEFATGKLANVFGPEYKSIDNYPRRVRLPADPFLLTSRVTRIDADRGKFERSFIQSEYDVPHGAWYCVDGQVPYGIIAEAGQCALVLLSYLGIDDVGQGERIYRLLDGTLTAFGPAVREGQRLRYDITIDRFAQAGGATLVFSGYKCYADGELFFDSANGCAGFFTYEELAASKGLRERLEPRPTTGPNMYLKPLARTTRTSLGRDEIDLLIDGRFADVFGAAYEQTPDANRSLRLNGTKLRMVDEILHMDLTGGVNHRGTCTAVKRLDPAEWYFASHFVGDPVMPGTLVAEGCVQVLQAYALFSGLHLCLLDATFQPIKGLSTTTKVRGQVTPATREITYELSIVDMGLLPRPYVITDVLVCADGVPVAKLTDVGLEIREKPGTPYRPDDNGRVTRFLGRRGVDGAPAILSEMHLAHIARGDHRMLGEEFAVYQRMPHVPRLPSAEMGFVDRMMNINRDRGDLSPGAVIETEYDVAPDAWFLTENGNFVPNFALMEAALQTTVLAPYYLGSTLRFPTEEFYLRNLGGQATVVRDVDLRGKTMRTRAVMLSSDAVGGAILHRAGFEVSVNGEVFYHGEGISGFFSPALRTGNVGLDRGQETLPWLDTAQLPPGSVQEVDVAALRAGVGSLGIGTGRLDLLDGLRVVPGGGRYGAGYLAGWRMTGARDWYFPLHFYEDEVMPGSLGIEAVLSGLRGYVMTTGMADAMARPRFGHACGVSMEWTYRGECAPEEARLDFDAHIKEVRREPGRLHVIGDASVWRNRLRIYECKNIAMAVYDDAEVGRS
ncbi:beta-ketoacyl synthase N-terminal-like domain-containing protein [Antrihabitans cavernicola]|uniref:Ketosynthase family 3 (KS3) domain-containing protein n=1 Tax=Antrihabitans cavernicola TaxID=2495913 RepID=A0A5A7SHR9_9NOCA|nr:beta-ketoacyl synthase N-terminal-like domain-containing protein [Spelaeibacter cavernicola]KAA0024153.1 hypothetical protein FOY51_06280 [Spelaeibacter cavernicola]